MVVATVIRGVAVGNAVGAVGAGVVAPASARCGSSGKDHNIDRDDDDHRQHGAHHDHHVEGDADPRVALLRGPCGPQRHDGQDEGGNGAHEEEERNAAAEQRDDGEDDRAHRHSRVVLLRRRPVNGRHRGRLGRHNDSSVGGGDGGRSGHRLVALLRLLPAIGVGGRLVLGRKRRRLLRRELGRSGLVSAFGVLLVGLLWREGLLIGVRSSHCATVNNTRSRLFCGQRLDVSPDHARSSRYRKYSILHTNSKQRNYRHYRLCSRAFGQSKANVQLGLV